MRFQLLAAATVLTATASLFAQPYATKVLATDKFRQLQEFLPTPNEQRTASGAPGRAYWQQRADYMIDAELDERTQMITGREMITYINGSPDELSYLWLQLDANIFAQNSDYRTTVPSRSGDTGSNPFEEFSYRDLEAALLYETYTSDLKVTAVTNADGKPLPHTIVKTMMRIDLLEPLAPGSKVRFGVQWSYVVNNAKLLGLRTGWEYFEKDQNYLYVIGQWYPRLAVYDDTNGWQHKQYLGSSEFALEFGDFLVRLTVPNDHVVAASGALQNPAEVLSPSQRSRLKKAETSKNPVFVVTPEEARAAETGRPTGKKTWIFKADNVRDFAFASSRKFIWDAMGASKHAATQARPSPQRQPPDTDAATNPVMAMSFYPKEAQPLWDKYSTHAIIQTLDVYSAHTIPYPYPVAQSVHGPIGGMEYPMICFVGNRPEEDGTYSSKTKYDLISSVIHEVGHNYFPMVINSNERQWGWMDEGLNTFCQNLAMQAWEKNFPPIRGGEPREIVAYMTSPNQVPIMTDPDSIAAWVSNMYSKPSTALNILRETVLGRELFDHAFKTYAKRWAFKRPYPADFFRTMEDASGVDLDWFWRGWFYTNDHVDVSLENVRLYSIDTRDPVIEHARTKTEKDGRSVTVTAQRNADAPKRVDDYPELKDFYNGYDPATVLPSHQKNFEGLLEELARDKINPDLLKTARNFYLFEFVNVGGLVTPIILKVDYNDGTSEELRLPSEIWRIDNTRAAKLVITTKELKSAQVDPHDETADANVENNHWPRRVIKSRFQLYKDTKNPNPMKELRDHAEKDANRPVLEPR